MTGTVNPALFGMPDATTAGVQAGVTTAAKQIDSTGQVVGTSGSAILGSTGEQYADGHFRQ